MWNEMNTLKIKKLPNKVHEYNYHLLLYKNVLKYKFINIIVAAIVFYFQKLFLEFSFFNIIKCFIT